MESPKLSPATTQTRTQTHRRRLNREERKDILVLRRLGYTYQAIAEHLHVSHRAVQYTCESNTCDPKKRPGRNSKLSTKQVDDIEAFLAASKENRKMSYKKIIEVLGLDVKQDCLRRALQKRGYTRQATSMPNFRSSKRSDLTIPLPAGLYIITIANLLQANLKPPLPDILIFPLPTKATIQVPLLNHSQSSFRTSQAHTTKLHRQNSNTFHNNTTLWQPIITRSSRSRCNSNTHHSADLYHLNPVQSLPRTIQCIYTLTLCQQRFLHTTHFTSTILFLPINHALLSRNTVEPYPSIVPLVDVSSMTDRSQKSSGYSTPLTIPDDRSDYYRYETSVPPEMAGVDSEPRLRWQ
ncbi:conserved hypothetical protein [Histoplasma capsulatum G186AR]|uniref:Transposase IS30-like HTH domain-containing protein n=1 Tax=Ajellomyces capsulatus (strain G186AR / H82 / ATCC MYA-2454 / RMSCC 2432) TaxID=447093 RepID=C0NHY9_AJECG|nr:uncharacterized protein HCBG_02961 [Histoplasma capsulatum G186AR]EEH09424.1 conserved hypothetical protein [Histoplasma capsulatum G186AR]